MNSGRKHPGWGCVFGMSKVYIANMGEANALWPRAKANSTILTYDNVDLHPFWQSGDREGYIATAIHGATTARGERPTKQTAGRWYNLIDELKDSEGDIWISRQGPSLWWTISSRGDLSEALIESSNPSRDGPEIWVLEKDCQPWSDRDTEGRPLLWEALHPKARDFLSTEATFQSVQNDRGYSDYARALVAGQPLDQWHGLPLFKEKEASSKKRVGKVFSPKEIAAARMARTMLATVSQSNGQTVESKVKEKNATLGLTDCEALLRRLMGEQEDLCALTGLPLGYDAECDDPEMLASLDRIDSNGHYTPENVQIVCRFMNRWKKADPDELVRRLLNRLRDHHRAG